MSFNLNKQFGEDFSNFSGTATRKEWWGMLGVQLLISVFVNIVATASASSVFIIFFLASLVLTIPWVATASRRLHSRNMSGWWQLVPFLSFVVGFLPSYKKSKILKKYSGTM